MPIYNSVSLCLYLHYTLHDFGVIQIMPPEAFYPELVPNYTVGSSFQDLGKNPGFHTECSRVGNIGKDFSTNCTGEGVNNNITETLSSLPLPFLEHLPFFLFYPRLLGHIFARLIN